jgi:chemotaxis protein histidine kinase CheA
MEVDQELFAIFKAEVEEQIDDLCERLARKPDRWKVDRLFQISHNVKGAARLVGVFPVRDAAHALEDLFDAVRQGLALSDEVVTVVRAGAELLDTCFQSIEGGEAPDISSFREQVSACIDGRKKVKRKAKKPGEEQPEEDVAGKRKVEAQDEERAEEKTEKTSRDVEDGVDARKLHAAQTIRVGADKLETMMGLSSELASHVFQYEGHGNLARKLAACLNLTIQQSPQLREDPSIQEAYRLSRELLRDLLDHATEALRLSDELQSAARALRMVRIEGLRTILNRAVREACAATGRRAELKIKGSDTGVDRVVQEQLRDPLVHILRNSVAHGIEPPAERGSWSLMTVVASTSRRPGQGRSRPAW